jgi:hypothetical protein
MIRQFGTEMPWQPVKNCLCSRHWIRRHQEELAALPSAPLPTMRRHIAADSEPAKVSISSRNGVIGY